MEETKKIIRTWRGNGKKNFLKALAKAERLLLKGNGVYWQCDDMRRYISVSPELQWMSDSLKKRNTYADFHNKVVRYADELIWDNKDRFYIYVEVSKTLRKY